MSFSGFTCVLQQHKFTLDSASQSAMLPLAWFSSPGYTSSNVKEG
ncbi:hypothetical protein ECL_00114 [Enterobacter cloacae subsp. cloacae ATCC 13047]|uniref:Uncharacterized protein n=1 Tax=Enterobacter cloacae subsp. cloacae (strain ATCC 13047 / DSM 30054 / NBRC 13535 / NCTC 10005 / WDCM 00083 / NCDC 279-56) TaxID=716541 RepID=A0A0H3CGJ6_ENTCC|nr:hypothetical protein ECL_00114 [Enterobacter cloacae subsp. cloacae ATCC 13047]